MKYLGKLLVIVFCCLPVLSFALDYRQGALTCTQSNTKNYFDDIYLFKEDANNYYVLKIPLESDINKINAYYLAPKKQCEFIDNGLIYRLNLDKGNQK